MPNHECIFCKNSTLYTLYEICYNCHNEILNIKNPEETTLLKPSIIKLKNLSQEHIFNENEKIYFQYYSRIHKFFKIKLCGKFLICEYNSVN